MRHINAKQKEIILYIIFGVLTTLVSWTTYAVFVNLPGFSVLVSNAVSWVFGVSFAFVTNKIWVFESKSWNPQLLLKEGVSFISSRIATGVIEVFGMPLLAGTGFDNIFFTMAQNLGLTMKIFYIKGIYSKAVVAVVVIILNYVFSKLIVFREKKKENL